MYKRLAVLLAIGLLLMGGMPVMAKTTISHLHYGSHGQGWRNFLDDRAAAFNASQSEIEVEIIDGGSGSQYSQKFAIMLAAGTPPDVTEFHPAMGAPYIISGTFSDLRPYLEKENINLLRLTSPAVMSVLTDNNGAVWGLPADIYPVVTFYNEDMFDNAGLPYPSTLGDRWDWEQARLSARKLTVDTNADGEVDIYGVDRMWARWYIWVHQVGAQLYDRVIDPTKSYWNDPLVIKGLEFPVSMIQEGIAMPSNAPRVAQRYFYHQGTAMSFVDGPGMIGGSLKGTGIRYNIAPQLRGPANSGTEITVDAWEIIDVSPNKDAAWEWVKFLSLDVESHSKLVEYTGRAPSLTQLQGRYRALNPDLPSNFTAFFASAGAAGTQTNYLLLQSSEIGAVVNPLMTQIMLGQIPIESGTALIHEHVSRILEEK
jgi:multiple sugar transport system substrate-binding protein